MDSGCVRRIKGALRDSAPLRVLARLRRPLTRLGHAMSSPATTSAWRDFGAKGLRLTAHGGDQRLVRSLRIWWLKWAFEYSGPKGRLYGLASFSVRDVEVSVQI